MRAIHSPFAFFSLSDHKITTYFRLTSSQFILNHPNSSIIIQIINNVIGEHLELLPL